MTSLSLESGINKFTGEPFFKIPEKKENSPHISIKDRILDNLKTKSNQSLLNSAKISEIAISFFAGTILFIFANNLGFDKGYENGYGRGFKDGVIQEQVHVDAKVDILSKQWALLEDDRAKLHKLFYSLSSIITFISLLWGPMKPQQARPQRI